MKYIAIFLSIILLPVLSSQTASAQPACPSWAIPDAPVLETLFQFRKFKDGTPVNIGPSLKTNSFYWTKGVWFEMPIGYQNPYPNHTYWWSLVKREKFIKLLAKNSSLNGFEEVTQTYNQDLLKRHLYPNSFSFWMPSLRFVERNVEWVPWLRPCETGREKPNANQYVVKFAIKWPFLPDSLNSAPGRPFRIIKKNIDEQKLLQGQGADIFEHTNDGPISGYKRYYIYHDDGDTVVHLICRPFLGPDALVNPSCTGSIWQRSSDLIIDIVFPSSEGQKAMEQRWKAPVNSAIKLATKWRDDGSKGL